MLSKRTLRFWHLSASRSLAEREAALCCGLIGKPDFVRAGDRRSACLDGFDGIATLFQVGVNDFDKFFRRIRIERARILLWIDQMGPNVVLDHLRHQAGDGTPYASDHVHDPFALGFLSQRTVDRLDLAFDPTDAGKELFLFPYGMAHCDNIAYPPILRNGSCHIPPGGINASNGQ